MARLVGSSGLEPARARYSTTVRFQYLRGCGFCIIASLNVFVFALGFISYLNVNISLTEPQCVSYSE